MAHGLAHLPDLTMAPFADYEGKPRLRTTGALEGLAQAHLRRCRAPAVDDNTAREPLERVTIRNAPHLNLVLTIDAVSGVSQVSRQVPVARQKQEPF
jgi:hypothetical protein